MGFNRRISVFALTAAAMVGGYTDASAQSFTESFDNISTLPGSGWLLQNNSTPVGSTNWFQGTATTATPTPGPFNSHSGAANAYIAANFNNTGSTGTISNWLLTPNRTLRNGDVLTFYTRKPTVGGGQTDYPDRLEVRLSKNGASTNVGTGAAGLGDFTTLLLSVNPTLVTNVYPQTWTQYTITISGLPAPTSGRTAFRYYVTGAGSLGVNSDYIGIDDVAYTPYVCPAFTMTAGGALSGSSVGSTYSASLSQTGALGAPNFAITAGALPPGLTQSASGVISGTPTSAGTFNFTTTVSDASGCSGSQAYSITVGKGSQSITFPAQSPTNQTFAPSASFSINPLAVASSGLTVGYESSTASICSVTGTTVAIHSAGICTLEATQAGDINYLAALPQSQDVTIDKAVQTISFTSTPPATPVVGDTYTVSATGGLSGNTVTFSIDPSTSGNCSITGNLVSFSSANSCVINANQLGNANYLDAPTVQQTVGVSKATQTIVFTSTAPANAKAGGSYTVTANGGLSGNAVTFTADSSSINVCSITDNVVSFNASGVCTINANQLGNSNYIDASQSQQSVIVGQAGSGLNISSSSNPAQAGQSITFTVTVAFDASKTTPVQTKAAPEPTGTVEISEGSTSLGVATLVNGSATISTTQLTTPGTHSLIARYSGDANFSAEVSEVFSQQIISGIATPVPTIGEWAVVALSSLMAIVGLIWIRRRND